MLMQNNHYLCMKMCPVFLMMFRKYVVSLMRAFRCLPNYCLYIINGYKQPMLKFSYIKDDSLSRDKPSTFTSWASVVDFMFIYENS